MQTLMQAGRRGGSGGNLVEQNTEGSFRILNFWEDDVMICALCWTCDYSESDFNPRTVMICDQCEMGFHVSCLKKHEIADLKEKPEGKWFCGENCREIHDSLWRLLDCDELAIPESLLGPAKEKLEEKKSDIFSELNVKWRLVKRGIASSEAEHLLSTSVAIFHDCFGSIEVAGKDLIQQMVDGENSDIHECTGMHCAVLTTNSTVVSTGLFRVFNNLNTAYCNSQGTSRPGDASRIILVESITAICVLTSFLIFMCHSVSIRVVPQSFCVKSFDFMDTAEYFFPVLLIFCPC